MFVCMMYRCTCYISIYTQDTVYFVSMCSFLEVEIPLGASVDITDPRRAQDIQNPRVFQHLRCEAVSFLVVFSSSGFLDIPGIRFHFKLIDATTCCSLTRYYKTFLYAEACVNFTNGLQNRLSQHWHRNEKDPSLNALALLRRDSSIPPCPATWSIMTYHAYHALTAS